jgi:hypothetical protein
MAYAHIVHPGKAKGYWLLRKEVCSTKHKTFALGKVFSIDPRYPKFILNYIRGKQLF